MITEKTLRLNKCTLEISGIDDLAKREYDELKEAMLIKIFIILFTTAVGIYNACYVFATKSVSDDDFIRELLFTMIPDFGGLIILIIFFIVLPRFNIKFQGMTFIAMALQLVLQVEFSVANYELDEVQYLYILS